MRTSYYNEPFRFTVVAEKDRYNLLKDYAESNGYTISRFVVLLIEDFLLKNDITEEKIEPLNSESKRKRRLLPKLQQKKGLNFEEL